MKAENFIKLICELTGRPFSLGEFDPFGDFRPFCENERHRSGLAETLDQDIEPGKVYCVWRRLPLSGRQVSFKWKAAIDEEKLLRSFLTAFSSGYFEPNPANYGPCSVYTEAKTWGQKTEAERESAFGHHRGNMFSKEQLMRQVEARFQLPEMRAVFMRHGFYATCYGVGIYCLFASASLEAAVEEMRGWLNRRGVGFTNEFSKAGWVLRFRLGLTREIHAGLLTEFSNASTI